MEPQISKLGNEIDFSFIQGITGSDIQSCLPYIYARTAERRALRDSEIAISLNFYHITQEFYRTGKQLCMICEDDVVFINPETLVRRFREYVQKSKVVKLESNIPHLLYGCYIEKSGLQAVTKKSTENVFHRSGGRYGNPFLIINRAFANLALTNFFPITLPYDDYLRQLLLEHTVRAYRAVPMLAYELSSDFYRSFYSLTDLEHKKHIHRESQQVSGLHPVINSKNAYVTQLSTTFTKFLLNVYGYTCIVPTLGGTHKTLVIHDIFEDTLSLKNTIVCGAGIKNPQKFKKNIADRVAPFLILSVRGPLTRRTLLKQKIWCPEKYGDCLLLISDVYNTPQENATSLPKIKIGMVCNEKEIKIIKNSLDTNNLLFISPQNVEVMCKEILKCTHVLSTYLQGIIIAHSYDKQAVWICTKKLKYRQQYKFLDYFAGLTKLGISSFKDVCKAQNILQKPTILQKLDSVSTHIPKLELNRIKGIIRRNNPVFSG